MCVVCFYSPPKVFQLRASYTESGSQWIKMFHLYICVRVFPKSTKSLSILDQMFHLCMCVVRVFVCVCFYNLPRTFQSRTNYTESGPQWTRCFTFVCVLCVYLCASVSIIHEKCSSSGQVTQSQARNDPYVPPLNVCCVCICVLVFLWSTKTRSNLYMGAF